MNIGSKIALLVSAILVTLLLACVFVFVQIQFKYLHENAGEDIIIAVKDTGVGLSNEQIQGLFEPFNQGDSSVSKRFGGTGPGLAICRRIYENMGGNIIVESIVDEGSTFTVTLPTHIITPDRI